MEGEKKRRRTAAAGSSKLKADRSMWEEKPRNSSPEQETRATQKLMTWHWGKLLPRKRHKERPAPMRGERMLHSPAMEDRELRPTEVGEKLAGDGMGMNPWKETVCYQVNWLNQTGNLGHGW